MRAIVRPFLASPVFADEDQGRAARLLHVIVLTVTVGAAIAAVILLLMAPDPLPHLDPIAALFPLSWRCSF
ncbi:MAG TPA: hypothetical protein VNL77_14115 [Roseiflexaceae bacterium]|nr:hypothetical protein [Roseiflexaceae bacterium]